MFADLDKKPWIGYNYSMSKFLVAIGSLVAAPAIVLLAMYLVQFYVWVGEVYIGLQSGDAFVFGLMSFLTSVVVLGTVFPHIPSKEEQEYQTMKSQEVKKFEKFRRVRKGVPSK